MDLAPGLVDLIEVTARSSVFDQSVDDDAASVLSSHRVSQSPLKVFSAKKLSLSARKAAAAAARRTPQSRSKASAQKSRSRTLRRSRYDDSDDEDEEEDDCIASLCDDDEEEEEEDDERSAAESDDDHADRMASGRGSDVLSVAEGLLSPATQRHEVETRRLPARASKSSAVKKIAVQLLPGADDDDSSVSAKSTAGLSAANRSGASRDENLAPN